MQCYAPFVPEAVSKVDLLKGAWLFAGSKLLGINIPANGLPLNSLCRLPQTCRFAR